jgi:hypothetical protein
MKIFVRVLSISLFFVTLGLQAQPSSSAPTQAAHKLGEADYKEAKMLYIKMLDSPNGRKSDSLSKLIVSKYARVYKNGADKIPSLSNDSLYIPWIKENLHLTTFKSLDEVLFLRDEWKKANVEINKENLPLYELMSKASKEQFRVIIQPSIDRNKPYFMME